MYSDFTAFSILMISMSTNSDPEKNPAQIDDPPKPGSSTSADSAPVKTAPCLGGLSATEAAENEGFVTPTNSDHRIPEVKSCPPPPKKSTAESHRRMRLLKRKRSAAADGAWSRRRQQSSQPQLLDLSTEIESMFPRIRVEPVADLASKTTKKARTL